MDTGINVVDTAECYQASEADLGRVLPGRRDRLVLVSKCGHNAGMEQFDDWDPRLLEQSIDRSLRRLQTDCLDVLLLHSCTTEILRRGDVIDVVERARAAGKTRTIGYSGDSQAARYAVETRRFQVLETSVSIADQESIDLTLPLARDLQVGVIAKRSLANVAWAAIVPSEGVVHWPRGYIDSYAERLRLLDYDFQHRDLREAVGTALRFALGQPGVSTAIIGTRRPERLRENAAYVEVGPLSEAQEVEHPSTLAGSSQTGLGRHQLSGGITEEGIGEMPASPKKIALYTEFNVRASSAPLRHPVTYEPRTAEVR